MLPGIIFSAPRYELRKPAHACKQVHPEANRSRHTQTNVNQHEPSQGHEPEPGPANGCAAIKKAGRGESAARHPEAPAKEAYSSFTRSGTDLKTSTHSVSGL